MKNKHFLFTTSSRSLFFGRHARLLAPWLLCLLLVLPASVQLFGTPLFVAHDYTHVGRITEMVNTLRSGQFPPRWSQHLGFGYGMPLFSFYAPLPYYAGSAMVIAGIPVTVAVVTLFFISTWGSSITMFYLARKNDEFLIPTIAAAIFIYLPYRAVDIFVRGALGELWGVWLLALVLLAIKNLARLPKATNVLLYAFALTLFLLSHNLMILMGLPVVAAYGLYQSLGRLSSWKTIVKNLFVGSLLGFLMAAFFVVPMFFEKQHTSVSTLTAIQGGYSNHFVYWKQLFASDFGYGGSIAGITDGISFSLGYAGWLSIVLGLLVITQLLFRASKKMSLGRISFWLLILAVSLFLTSAKSLHIWQSLEAFSYIQFPWRFLSLTLIALPMLFAVSMQALQKDWFKKVVSLVILGLLLFEVKNFTPNPEVPNKAISTISDHAFISTELSKTIPDYIHPKLSDVVTDPKKVLKPAQVRFETTPFVEVAVQKDTASIAQAQVPATDEATTVRANIFDFPGWIWSVEGIEIPHQTADELPVMEVSIPASTQPRTITVAWSETPLRKVSNALSALSWLGASLYMAFLLLQIKSAPIKPASTKP
jgi:hypothetical protein